MVPDARIEVRPNGEIVGGHWFGPRQALGVLESYVLAKPTKIKLNRTVELAWVLETQFASVGKTLPANTILLEVEAEKKVFTVRTQDPLMSMHLAAQDLEKPEQLSLVTLLKGQESERLTFKRLEGDQDGAIANQLKKMDELLKGRWKFRGLRIGGTEIWSFSNTIEQIEADFKAAPEQEQLFSKGLIEGLKEIEFSKRFELSLGNGQKTSFAWNPVSGVLDVDAAFAKSPLFSRLEFKVQANWREKSKETWLHLDLLGLEQVGKIPRPVEVRFYFQPIQ